jgi:hypothetical protein
MRSRVVVLRCRRHQRRGGWEKDDESGAVYCMSTSPSSLLTGPVIPTPEPGDTPFPHPADPPPSAGRVARANAGRVAVKHTIPVLLNLIHRQLTQRIERACNPLALASPPLVPQPVNSLSRIWINSSSSSAAASKNLLHSWIVRSRPATSRSGTSFPRTMKWTRRYSRHLLPS